MDSNSTSSSTTTSCSIDTASNRTQSENNSTNLFKVSSLDSLDEIKNIKLNKNSERKNSLVLLDEDHFSIHSESDLFSDFEFVNFSKEKRLEMAIAKNLSQLESLKSSDMSKEEIEKQQRKLVKKICDYKFKLAELKEDIELREAFKENASSLNHRQSLNEADNLIYFKRNYSFTKVLSNHKLVLANDIHENEKRLLTVWKNWSRNSNNENKNPPPLPLSPTSASPLSSSMMISTSRMMDLLASNQLTATCLSLASTTDSSSYLIPKPTNPLDHLVCDQCARSNSNKSIGNLLEALKLSSSVNSNIIDLDVAQQHETLRSNNPYLICIYCFYTVHYNCLTKTIRKCPKLFFDEDFLSLEEIFNNEFYCRLYNFETPVSTDTKLKDKKSITSGETNLTSSMTASSTNKIIDSHQKRMSRIIFQIRPEIGLSKQDFRCAECHTSISSVSSSSSTSIKARLCDYSGLYFCDSCHFNETAIIPARVVHNWDFHPRPVSRAALQVISYLRNRSFHYDRPILVNLVEINSMLYGLVDELIQIKRLRVEMCHIYKYISLCKQPSKPRQWMACLAQFGSHLLNSEEVNYLSFNDICDLKSLVTNLAELETLFINHITTCEGCRGKGFYCELCPNKDDLLFSFSPNTTICAVCQAVFHK